MHYPMHGTNPCHIIYPVAMGLTDPASNPSREWYQSKIITKALKVSNILCLKLKTNKQNEGLSMGREELQS